jgi:hypothetical protein
MHGSIAGSIIFLEWFRQYLKYFLELILQPLDRTSFVVWTGNGLIDLVYDFVSFAIFAFFFFFVGGFLSWGTVTRPRPRMRNLEKKTGGSWSG